MSLCQPIGCLGKFPRMSFRHMFLAQPTGVSCGVTCLGIALRLHYKKTFSFIDLSGLCELDRNGTSIRQLINAANALGCHAVAQRKGWLGLLKAPLPVIAFVNYGHFVVIARSSNGSLLIVDPAIGCYWITRDQFESISTGIVIELTIPETPLLTYSRWHRRLGWKRLFWPAEYLFLRKLESCEVIQTADPW